MEIGLFVVPFRLPETKFKAGFDWDMQVIQWAEEFGLSELWFGEHTTLGWEPSCSPEIYIATAARETERIRLASGANVLPNHNPVALAHRLMMLDHLSQGRLMVGVGAGAYGADQQIHGASEPHAMMTESLEIIKKIWNADGPFKYEGKFWTCDYPAYSDSLAGPHWKPFQEGGPPLAMAGLSPKSSTLYQAGLGGYMPLSFNVATDYLAGHWERYVEGAEEAGHVADRNQWRSIHNVFVADTDEEAYDLAVNGAMGRTYEEWILPGYKAGGMMPIMAPEVSNPDDVTSAWLAKNKWLVGSPDTVVERLHNDLEVSGGFGKLIPMVFEYSAQPEAYRRHLELLGTEVLPRIKDITHDNQSHAELTASAAH